MNILTGQALASLCLCVCVCVVGGVSYWFFISFGVLLF